MKISMEFRACPGSGAGLGVGRRRSLPGAEEFSR
jgi:hypothetical protein